MWPPVARPRLTERLDAGAARIIAVLAPAGFGKSTLLSQWCATGSRRVAWLTVDQRDNDPSALVQYVDIALARAGADPSQPFTLVIDNAERLNNPAAIEAILALAEAAPEGSHIAISTRTIGNWPIPRMCASGSAICLGPRDLALGDDEAAEMMSRSGMAVKAAAARQLNHEADGWAAGLYLHARESIRGAAGLHVESASSPAAGSLLAEYIRVEFLRGLDADELQFLVRTSILEQLNKSLCDAVIGGHSSDGILGRLDRTHGLLIRSTSDTAWYRLPAMVRTVLRAELEKAGVDTVAAANVRAAAWFEAHGRLVDAAEHAAAASDHVALGRVLPGALRVAIAAGRSGDAAGWIHQLEASGNLDRKPELSTPVALALASIGDGSAADRWAESSWVAAKRRGRRAALARASLARSLMCRWGWPRMRADARVALRLLPRGDEDLPIAHLLLGVAEILAGEPDRGDALLARASSSGGSAQSGSAQPASAAASSAAGASDAWPAAMALALRASQAHTRRERSTTESLLHEARALVIRGGLDDEPAGVLVNAVAARFAASRGLAAQGRADLESALDHLRVTTAIPWLAARVRLDLAATQLSLGDLAGASSMLAELRSLVHARPRLGTLEAEVERLEGQLRASREAGGEVALTAAELRLLPYLATHLSMSEIAAKLIVSTNTIKTEAKSIYHKLSVSCRSDAVQRATEIGLLQPRDELLATAVLPVSPLVPPGAAA